MRKLCYLALGILCILVVSISCKEDIRSTAFDPNKPILFSEFLPDSGGIRTKFIIKGSNFGDDKSKVKVFFKDEEGTERESLILGMTSDVIYTQVPKQSNGQSHIRVSVEGQDAKITNPDKTFKYTVASSVSTVVGKAKEPGDTNGTVGETTFKLPYFAAIDNDDNLFVMDNPRTRLVSLSQNKTITLYDAGIFDQPQFLSKDRTKLLCPGDNAATGCFLFDANISWVPESYGQLLEAGGWMHSIVLDPVDSTFIVYRRNTGPLYTQPFKKGMTYSKARQIGTIGTTGSNGLCAYNPVDRYVYCVLNNYNAIYRWKLGRGEDGWPIIDGEVEHYIDNGLGFADGSVSEAKFANPHGLAIDAEGYIYIADTNNHKIRKIDTSTGMVTTVAGTGNKGYKDGDPKDAEFFNPWGVCIDKNGFIYIVDQGNYCVRKLAIE